jgi:DNA-directed RNA polymerase subunit RPC12/RpoP
MYKKGKDNFNYKNGKYCKKYYCIDCGKEISVGSTRCMSCSNKIKARNKISKNKTYRRNPICIDCGKKLSNSYASRCPSCSRKYIRKNKYWSSNKNKKLSPEHRKKLSETRIRLGLGKGDKNYNWKNFKVKYPLYKAIRHLPEYKTWRNQIFKRDNYTCQECGHIGRPIECHHIKEFIIIFNEFLSIYSQFSPMEDKETLLRLATTYEPFWNINSGQILCKKCHKKTKYLNQYNYPSS